MNILAICLVLTSLVTGGVWSPTPENPNLKHNPDPNKRDTIVKEGHRVVVVEYEKEGDGNTKVVISPGGVDDKGGAGAGCIHAAEEKLSETVSATKGAVVDVKEKVKDATYSPRELVCDAFGKCKHKLASALFKAKDKVSETAHGVSDKVHDVSGKVHDVEEHVKEVVGEAYEKAKGAVASKTHEGVEKGKEIGGATKEAASEALKKMKENVPDMAGKVEDWDVVDSAKRVEQDIRQNLSSIADGPVKEKVRHTKVAVEDAVGHVGEAVEEVKEKGKKGLNQILRHIVYNFLCYVIPLRRLDSAMDVLQLFGVSTAYGMCIFVSLVSSYVLSRVLPKQQFGMVQSRLYPVYFRALGFSVGVGLLGHLLSQRRRVFADKLVMFQAFDLAAALLTVFANMFYLEPRATKV